MKKLLYLLLIVLIMFHAWGCTYHSSASEPVPFYYQRVQYQFGSPDGVIASEHREAVGHTGDIQYLLTLYLRGPLDPALKSPFPTGTALLDWKQEDRTLSITLTNAVTGLDDLALTLACACLAKTCFEIASVDTVQIYSGSPTEKNHVDILLTPESLLELDTMLSP